MNIVLEGVDGSGKSTLAAWLSQRLHMPVQSSEGPPHYPGEINTRIRRYLMKTHTIFDRHPVISQPIYNMLREEHEPVDEDLVNQFYATNPVIIFCRATMDGFNRHVINPSVDTHDHLRAVQKSYSNLVLAYNDWAMSHAHIIYQIGQRRDLILRAVTPGVFQDIIDFHEKYELTHDGGARELPDDMRMFRESFLEEEVLEYCESMELADRLDALVDTVYVALGNAYLHGFNFDEAWRRVHAANMKKVRAARASESKRDSTYDVVKPPGWCAPDLSDLVDNSVHSQI